MHVIKGRHPRSANSAHESGLARATGQIQTQRLLDLIGESAPEDSVVDVHEIEAKFANGSRRIALVPPEEAAVVAVVEGAADTTRRKSAVDLDAAVAAVEAEVHSESTMRMSAIQANQLAALITPVEVSLVDELPRPPSAAETPSVMEAPMAIAAPMEPIVEPTVEPIVEPIVRFAPARPPVDASEPRLEDILPRRATNWWLIGGLVAVATAAAALVLVAL